MPTYEYVCRSCGHLFEIVQSMKDEALTECPVCGGELRKVFAPPAISFKGSGFYATDHGRNQKSSERSSEKADKADKPEKTERGDSKEAKKDSPASAPAAEKSSDSGPRTGHGSGSSKSRSNGSSPKEGTS